MARRNGPSRAFRTRDTHRRWLTLHFALYLAGMVGAFFANRNLTPELAGQALRELEVQA